MNETFFKRFLSCKNYLIGPIQYFKYIFQLIMDVREQAFYPVKAVFELSLFLNRTLLRIIYYPKHV